MIDDERLLDVLERSRELGLLGPGPLQPHIDHAEGFVALLEDAADGTAVLDLGSGGGLPGLVIGVARPRLSLTLLDASERRVAFLRAAVRQLGLAEVTVSLGRAETLARSSLRERFDVVVARSFGAPAVTAECAVGFLRPTGRALVSEPDGVEDRWPADGLATLGLRAGTLHRLGSSSIRELIRTGAEISGLPRRSGVPARSPRF